MKKLGGGVIAWTTMFLIGSPASSFAQTHTGLKPGASTGQQSPDASEPGHELKSQLASEWEYRYNNEVWRRYFNQDGTIELWRGGKRDGTWLSDLRWKVRKVGDNYRAEIFKGDEKIADLKPRAGGKELNWEDYPKKGGPHMTRVATEDFWRR